MRELRGLVQQQQCKINDLQTEVAELKLLGNEMKREMQLLKVSYSLIIVTMLQVNLAMTTTQRHN